MKDWFGELEWQCHICRQMRPDEQISVHTHQVNMDNGFKVTVNVRYCNDNPDCTEKAKTYSFFESTIIGA